MFLGDEGGERKAPQKRDEPAQAAAPAAQQQNRGRGRARGGPGARGGRYYPRGGGNAAARDGAAGEQGDEAPTERRSKQLSFNLPVLIY